MKIPTYNMADYEPLGDGNLVSERANDFNERNCYLSQFNKEYLHCCWIANYIQCLRINDKDFKKGF